MMEWFESDYKEREGMVAIDYDITVFVFLLDNYVMVVEGVNDLQDSS